MNKMTTILLVSFLFLILYGTKVYAQESKDTVQNVEVSIENDSLQNQFLALNDTLQSLKEAINEIKNDKPFSAASLKNTLFVILGIIILILILIIIAFNEIAGRVRKKNLNKFEKDINNLKSQNDYLSQRIENIRQTQASKASVHKTVVNPSPKQSVIPSSSNNAQNETQKKNDDKKQSSSVRHQSKTIYCMNNDDLLVKTSETKLDRYNFVIEYDPDDSAKMGTLSFIGEFEVLRTMNEQSREMLFKTEGNIKEAKDYVIKRPGRAVLTQDVWKVINKIEVQFMK